MELGEVIGLFLKAFLIANLIMLVFALMTWIERRVISFFQYRLGPNRVGLWGILQPIADLLKLIRKENFSPKDVSQVLHVLSPILTLFFALGVFAVVPFGVDDWHLSLDWIPGIDWGTWVTPAGMAPDLEIGVLLAVALSGLGGYGVIVGGWASNSKYALLGALRACAQLISYEVSLALSLLPIVIMTGSLSMADIASGHTGWEIVIPFVDWTWSPWFIVWAPAGFGIFVLAALAEANRAPFDHAEAEQELVGGFHTEFGGLRYAAFANAEYLHMLAICSIGVAFFLGGASVPYWETSPAWAEFLAFVVKLAFLLFLFMWIRATVPRLRYDRLMRMGWKVLLPIATVQFLVTATLVSQGWGRDEGRGGTEQPTKAAPAQVQQDSGGSATVAAGRED